MTNFVPSPLFDNWFLGKKVQSNLIICSPYIKKDSVIALLDHFGIVPGNNNPYPIDVYTSGNPITYLKRSSDISALRYLASIDNVRIHLLTNIHMKAYCIDKKQLLVGSGNWTPSGLFPRGNVEAALSSEKEDDIEEFLKYCSEMDQYCTTLSSLEEIMQYCNELESAFEDNRIKLEGMADLEGGLSTESMTHHVRGYRIGKRVRPKPEFSPNPSDLDDARRIIIVDETIDISVITPEIAYLLGGLVINGFETAEIDGRKKLIIYYRVNGKSAILDSIVRDTSEHVNQVIDILDNVVDDIKVRELVGGERKQFFGGKCGFVIALDYDETFNPDNIGLVLKKIKESPPEIQRAFIIGAFDSKATSDKTTKLISMDSRSLEMGEAFNELLVNLGIDPTPVNKPRERENPDQKARWPQIRAGLKDYYEKIGIVSPGKARIAASILDMEEKIDDTLLPKVRKL